MSKSLTLFLVLFALALPRVSRAVECACAQPHDRIKVGFKQVARFAGKITTRFYTQNVELAGTARSFTAGSVGTQTYGCGEFADTVFVTLPVGQEITIISSFVDDPESPDYTVVDPVNPTILTVVSLPSAPCLKHLTKLTPLGDWQRVIPGIELSTAPVSGNTAVTKFVTYGSGPSDARAAGSSSGPMFGVLAAPPPRPDFLDAAELGVLCDSEALVAFAAKSERTPTTGMATAWNQPSGQRARSSLVARVGMPSARNHQRVADPYDQKGGVAVEHYAAKRFGTPKIGRRGSIASVSLPTPNWLQAKPATGARMKRPAEEVVRDARAASAVDQSVSHAAPAAAMEAPPGSVAQRAVGALNLAMTLGYQQGSLYYVTPAVDAAAYTPAMLHVSDDAKVQRVVTASNGDLRQISLPEALVDIRTVSSTAFEVRFYPGVNVGAFDGTSFPVPTDVPSALWRIENPDPSPAGRVRFTFVSGGSTTTHIAQWRPASADDSGAMTIAYHNEAVVETRTYYLYTNPYARGERVQRRAGPLATPGAIASDTFEVYREFYNWGNPGEVFEQLIEHTDDPAGAALVTTYVYYDVQGIAANALNGVIHPDGYWERYGRYADGSVSKVYRPHLDNPASPAEATDGNSHITVVSFPSTGDPNYQIEISEDTIQNTAITRHEEVYRQATSAGYLETKFRFLDGGSFVRSQTLYSGRNGLVRGSSENDGRQSSFSYEAGSWNPSSLTFTLSGAGIPARRTVEVRGSSLRPSGIANTTLVAVTVHDNFDRAVLEELYVNDGAAFAPSLRSDPIERIVRSFDNHGMLTAETRNGFVVYEAGYDSEGRLAFQVDQVGVRTEYSYDPFSRVRQTITKRGSQFPDQVVTYEYDAADRTRIVTRSAESLSLLTEYRYDVAGRRTHSISPAGLVETRNEAFYVDANGNPARQEVTTTSPTGATTIVEYYRDRTVFKRSGTAVPSEFWAHAYSVPAGFKLSYIYRQLSDASPLGFQAANWRGDVIQSSQMNFGGSGTYNRLLTYNGDTVADGAVRGLLSAVTSTGEAPLLFEYDEFGRRTATGVDLNGNGLLDRLGNEPLATYTDGFELSATNGQWSRITRAYRHLEAVDVPTLHEESRESLTKLGTGVLSDRIRIDTSGRRLRDTETLDRATSTRIITRRDLAMAPEVPGARTTEVAGLLRSFRPAYGAADTVYSYDGLDRVVRVNDPASGDVSFVFDSRGQCISRTEATNRTTTFTYHPNGASGAGELASLTDAAGQTTRYAYTNRNLLFRQWGANAYPVEYIYDDQDRVTGLRTFRTLDPAQGVGGVDWSQPAWPTGVTGDLTRWTFDYWSGLLARKTYPDGNGISLSYDASLRLWRQTNARNQIVTYGYNPTGQLISVAYPAGSSTADLSYEYDRGGRRTRIADGSGTRTMTYTPFDELSGETRTAGLLSGTSVAWTLDTDSRPASVSVFSGSNRLMQSTFGYDSFSRLSSIDYLNRGTGGLHYEYTYEPGTGRIATMAATQGAGLRLVTSKLYDSTGQLTASQTATGTGQTVQRFTRTESDLLGRVKKLLREDGAQWEYDYNVRGEVIRAAKKLSAARGGRFASGWQAEYSFDTIGNRVSVAQGGDESGADLRGGTYTANALNQYISRAVPGSIFLYGEANTLAAVDISVNEQPVALVKRYGEYAGTNYFSSEHQVDNTIASYFGTSRVRASVGGGSPMAAVGSIYIPKSPEEFSYDADGNLLSDDRWVYSWDVENRLVSVETRADRLRPSSALPTEARLRLQFVYDAEGRRVQKRLFRWSSGANAWAAPVDVTYLFDRWNPVAEFVESGGSQTLRSTYCWGLDISGDRHGAAGVGALLVQSYESSTPRDDYLYAYDTLGNVSGIISATTGALAAEYEYNPFGEVLKMAGSFSEANQFRFGTKLQDETGHVNFGLRYLNPALGRWLSRDPISERGGVNLYGFVENAPTHWTDPLGLALYAFDGTGNDGWKHYAIGKETNVYALYNHYETVYKNYLPGVGTNDGWLNILGLFFGLGGKARERTMLRLAGKWLTEGERVADITGFSRGAVQARDFAHRVREAYPCISVRWMGLFDSVATEGLPNDVNIGYKLGIPEGTGSVLHITAGNERRRNLYALSSIRVSATEPNPNPDYVEEEMPTAVHSDVGGYYGHNRGLANQALLRMWQHGRDHGVPFRPLDDRYADLAPKGPNESVWLPDRLIEFLTGSPRIRNRYFHP